MTVEPISASVSPMPGAAVADPASARAADREPGSASSADPAPAADPRQRLIEGMAAAVGARGYAATTVADVVRAAGVSKRTFYEHFTAKEPCFLALYELVSRRGLAAMQAAIDPGAPWSEQVAAGLTAWFGWLARAPHLLRPMFIELPALGESGLSARRQAMRALTDYLLTRAQATPGHAELSPEIALAIVGGINELIVVAIEEDRLDRIGELATTAQRLVSLATGANAPR